MASVAATVSGLQGFGSLALVGESVIPHYEGARVSEHLQATSKYTYIQ
jgi:hypothetical protein